MQKIMKRFNQLTTSELYSVLKKREAIFIVEQNCPYHDCDDKDIEAYHLMFFDNDNLAAYLRILPKRISYLEISIGRVLVDPLYRGQHLGTSLLQYAIEFIETELLETDIRISAQVKYQKLYEKVGFVTIGNHYLEDSISHVEMLYSKNF